MIRVDRAVHTLPQNVNLIRVSLNFWILGRENLNFLLQDAKFACHQAKFTVDALGGSSWPTFVQSVSLRIAVDKLKGSLWEISASISRSSRLTAMSIRIGRFSKESSDISAIVAWERAP